MDEVAGHSTTTLMSHNRDIMIVRNPTIAGILSRTLTIKRDKSLVAMAMAVTVQHQHQ
jgi:hypothetical protein